jgi:hypothetical protein
MVQQALLRLVVPWMSGRADCRCVPPIAAAHSLTRGALTPVGKFGVDVGFGAVVAENPWDDVAEQGSVAERWPDRMFHVKQGAPASRRVVAMRCRRRWRVGRGASRCASLRAVGRSSKASREAWWHLLGASGRSWFGPVVKRNRRVDDATRVWWLTNGGKRVFHLKQSLCCAEGGRYLPSRSVERGGARRDPVPIAPSIASARKPHARRSGTHCVLWVHLRCGRGVAETPRDDRASRRWRPNNGPNRVFHVKLVVP